MLLGRQRTSKTVYRYDDDGRLVEAVTTHDAEWLPEDVEGLRLLDAYEQSVCDGCGQPLAESLDPAHRREYSVRIVPCNGCESKQLMLDDWARSQRDAGMPTPPVRTVVTPDWR